MAEGKKSFIAYCDWIETFEELSDEEAGRLVKHLFKYVNDENPEASDKITKMCFIPIQQSLKRDLEKYDKYINKQKVNGSKGGRPKKNPEEPKKPKPLFENPTEPKKADSVSVSVSVIDTKKEKDANAFSFKNELISLGVEDQILKDWMSVRRKKKATDSKTSLDAIKKQIELSGKSANECIKICVERDWKGFSAEWIKDKSTLKSNDKYPTSLTTPTYEELKNEGGM